MIALQAQAGTCQISSQVVVKVNEKGEHSYTLHRDSTAPKDGLSFSKCAQLARNAANMGLDRAKDDQSLKDKKVNAVITEYRYEEINSPVLNGQVKVENNKVL